MTEKPQNVWDFDPKKDDVNQYLERLQAEWWAADWGFILKGKQKLKLELHTGGYSDNEAIISQFRETWFWGLYWVKSLRGGHYYFEIESNERCAANPDRFLSRRLGSEFKRRNIRQDSL